MTDVGELVERLRQAADTSASGGGEWYQLVHRCREAATALERVVSDRDTLRARLETVEAETRERCARELSLRRLALDHQTEVLDIAREMDIYDICIDAIRNLEPRHD